MFEVTDEHRSVNFDKIVPHALAHSVTPPRARNGEECCDEVGRWLVAYTAVRQPNYRVEVVLLGANGRWTHDYGWCGHDDYDWWIPLRADGTPLI